MRRFAIAALALAALGAPTAEYVIRDPDAVKNLLDIKDHVAFSDAQLATVLEWLNARYQVETAMGLDARGKPDTEHTVQVQPTLTIKGEMTLRELLDAAATGTGWTWSVDEHGTVVFMPPADAATAPAPDAVKPKPPADAKPAEPAAK